MGLPSVATDVGGVSELLANTGLLVPADNPQAMAEAMSRMHNDAQLRETFAANSRTLAPQYSVSNRADRMEAIYRDLLTRRGLSTE